MTPTHHTLDYVEIAAPDLPAAVDFYARAFGWQFTHYGPGYAGIRAADGDGEVGGLSADGVPGTGGPLVLLFSADLDATVDAVVAAGGTVVNGPYAFPGGRRFHFHDPAGNELGVWAAAPE
ncbi:VOC family protein [Cellulomonas xylanilytica]|uniref:Glyoxalase n=1 Tax=Cellulomonas xylanilytica TaxID=233583 RepID=A0A510V9E4_9CELL|nr:VOC family protein [Cellulomonas xylanilytica]GEK21795.1 glyoxalase [Cellulomonas xylanilytica]